MFCFIAAEKRAARVVKGKRNGQEKPAHLFARLLRVVAGVSGHGRLEWLGLLLLAAFSVFAFYMNWFPPPR